MELESPNKILMISMNQLIKGILKGDSSNRLSPTCCYAALSLTALLHFHHLLLALSPPVLSRANHHRGEADCPPALGPTGGVTGTRGSGGVSSRYAVNWGRHFRMAVIYEV